jgi:hypothetical protein
MIQKIASILFIVFLLSGQAQAAARTAQDDMNLDLSRVDRLIIPASQQCIQAQPVAIIGDFEGAGDFTVSGAGKTLDESQPIFGQRSLALHLSGSTPAIIKLNVQNIDPSKYTGVLFWVRPSVDGIKISVGIVSQKGTFTSRSQTLRNSGEALPVYFDFTSIGPMAHDVGNIKAIILTFTPVNGGDVVLDNVGLADASYGSFNQAWWDESYGKRFVDQRYQETINDYLTLLSARGDASYKDAIVRGMDNIILSRQPDGWVEAGTTGMITAGTLGATLANAYIVLKDDPAMDKFIDVYGDTSHTRRWWIEKTLDMDVRFIDGLFSMDPNKWIVRNQLMEGARATYCAYLATGNSGYLDDYRQMMGTIKAGRQGPLGIYPEWSKTYDTNTVMYDASYSAVQLSTLLSLAALGDRDYALPMARDLFGVLENVIDPSTGMIMNLNSSRKDLEGDLRWQDGMLYYLGTKEGLPGFVHLGYLENKVSPGKVFSDNFHSALARYYDLKYYVFPEADNDYLLPLECPIYSIDNLDISGNVISTEPAYVNADGSVNNPRPSRGQATFIKVNGFGGKVMPSQNIKAWFEDGRVYLEGSGPVIVNYSSLDLKKAGVSLSGQVPLTENSGGAPESITKAVKPDGTLEHATSLNGALELRLGNNGTIVTAVPSAAVTTSVSLGGISSLAAGSAIFVIVILLAVAAVLLQRKRKS